MKTVIQIESIRSDRQTETERNETRSREARERERRERMKQDRERREIIVGVYEVLARR